MVQEQLKKLCVLQFYSTQPVPAPTHHCPKSLWGGVTSHKAIQVQSPSLLKENKLAWISVL